MGEEVLEGGDAARAANILTQVRDMAPDDPEVAGGAGPRADRRQPARRGARRCSTSLGEPAASHAAVARARAALELAAAPAADTAPRKRGWRPTPTTMRRGWRSPMPPSPPGTATAAADELLEIVARDRDWNDGAARSQLLKLLEAAGYEDPWGRAVRRRLSALLFT